ncbi:MAG: PDZ domain-containing protein, partial [Armatimonadota bacterium]
MRRLVSFLALALLTVPALAQVERGEPLPRKGAMGIQFAPATAEEAKAAGVTAAVKVVRVVPGLTAQELKVQPNDLVTSINGTPVTSGVQVAGLVRTQASGAKITLGLIRDGKPLTLEGPLVARPKQQEAPGLHVVYDQVVSQGKRIRVIATHPDGNGPFPTV